MVRHQYKTRALATAIAASLSLGFAAVAWATPQSMADGDAAQAAAGSQLADQGNDGQPTELKTIVVNGGIRAAQSAAIQRKRFAPNISDSISAEDIGKLPDPTITDSLQRIPGVQIDRSGGEGSSLNVRGLPQVGMTINGEAFMTANNIVSTQPNFTTVPAALMAGADVIKTPTASLLNNGITGTVNLRTRRPFQLKSGWTFSGSVNGSRGSEIGKTEPQANMLLSFNDDGQWGMLFGASYSDLTHQNSVNGMAQYGGVLFGENAASTSAYNGFLGAFGSSPIPSDIAQLGAGDVDVNGDGRADGAFYGSENFTAFENELERKRIGLNASFQARLGDALRLTADAFYTHQQQHNRTAGYQLNSASWTGATFVPVVSRDTGAVVSGPYNNNAWSPGQKLYTTQVYKKWLGDFETYSQNQASRAIARNFNVKLSYNNGGNFTGDIRWVGANASQQQINSYLQFSNADGSQWPNDPVNAAAAGTYIYPSALGGNRVFNPTGYAPNVLPVTVDMRGTNMAVYAPAGLQTFLDNPSNYALKTVSSEGNHVRQSAMNVFRADGHYFFDESGWTLDFGLRNSIRTASNTAFNYVAPVYAGMGASDPSGCLVRWKAADVVMNGGGVAGACTAGNAQGYFRAGVLSAQNPDQLPDLISQNMRYYSSLAGVTGLGSYMLDPAAMDDPLAFQEALYPGEQRNISPGGTWDVFLKETTAYLQADFNNPDAVIPFSGNIGVRAVRTDLHVTQHIVGPARAYGLLAEEGGTTQTVRSYTDILPAANLSLNFTPSLKLRLAYSKNMMPLNLNQWGGGLTLSYGIDTSNPGIFRVLGGTSQGNPNLDPWRSSNFDASLEWYGQYTMASMALFYIKVDSFISNGTVRRCDIPDQDGTVRRCVAISGPIQGEGDSLRGAELNLKQNFRFLPGLFSHFGMGANFTYSPSDIGTDLAGNAIPFPDNSKYQANLSVWYQDDRLQVRVAGNYRSKRAVSQNYGGIAGLEMYQAPTVYVDASINYAITPNVSVYLQGSNLTGEHERYYLTWEDQVARTRLFERRYVVGARVNF